MLKKKWSRKIKRRIFLKIKPDIFSHSFWFAKLINKFMQRGKKSTVEKIIFRAFKKVKKEFHKDALKILFLTLIKNRPILGFVPIRISRETKQIPFPLSPRRQLITSLTWFVIAIRYIRYHSKNVSIETVLYTQFKAVIQKEKTILTRRRIKHIKELIQNRVNLHFRYKLKR